MTFLFYFSMKQAAGVKRLLFCGVGCQVQGTFYYDLAISTSDCFLSCNLYN